MDVKIEYRVHSVVARNTSRIFRDVWSVSDAIVQFTDTFDCRHYPVTVTRVLSRPGILDDWAVERLDADDLSLLPLDLGLSNLLLALTLPSRIPAPRARRRPTISVTPVVRRRARQHWYRVEMSKEGTGLCGGFFLDKRKNVSVYASSESDAEDKAMDRHPGWYSVSAWME